MPRQAVLASTIAVPTWYNPRIAPPYPAYGQVIFDAPGIHYWTCPEGVKEVSVVCIGGGGSGAYASTFDTRYHNNTYYRVALSSQSGGGGGGLGYRTFREGLSGYNSPLVPGTTYTVVVGKGGYSSAASWLPSSGGQSYFISAVTVSGGGGAAGTRITTSTGIGYGGTGGNWYGDGGGNGGNGGGTYGNSNYNAGGGGAGGYGYNGGAGGGSTNAGSASGNGTNGFRSGAGGSFGYGTQFLCHIHDYKGRGGDGGGVTPFGVIPNYTNTTYGGVATQDGYGITRYWDEGEQYGNPIVILDAGLHPTSYYYTSLNKNTVDGVYYAGYTVGTVGTYGAGSGGEAYTPFDGAFTQSSERGSQGCVRIIWGGKSSATRYYPSTRVGDETSQPTI